MKKEFMTPDIKIANFAVENIVTASGGEVEPTQTNAEAMTAALTDKGIAQVNTYTITL